VRDRTLMRKLDEQSDAAMEALSRVQTTAVPGLQPADKFTCVAC
jgi:hypothetical protein